MSLDGYTAGPKQSREDPLAIGGTGLHDWAFPLAAWRAPHGLEGGEVNESTAVMHGSHGGVTGQRRGHDHGPEHVRRSSGAMGRRRAVERVVGHQSAVFHHPVFVLTHHARPPLQLERGTTFTFVTDGIEAALELARSAARGRDVALAGGANAAQQYLREGLVDDMEIHLVPIFLGSGERLFEGVGDLSGLRHARTVAAPGVTRLKFIRR
jgi:dihydrofolate reductase